jgi:2-hydroxycyclohexanecarboxyl-CoA dehydrogenase
MDLSGKTALVTGAGGGIGRAITLALAQAGAQVGVLDIARDRAESVRDEAAALGVKALALPTDLTRRSEVNRAVETMLGQFGQIDVLVNNAGGDRLQFFLESEEETWDWIIALNFRAVLYTCKAVLPHMVARGAGRVVNIASDAGRVGSSGEAVYAAAKGGVIAFTKAMARELARWQITVNCICPGPSETPLFRREVIEPHPKLAESLARAIPLGRLGTPQDVAPAVLFLAGDDAGYITGQTLSVSGGLTMA